MLGRSRRDECSSASQVAERSCSVAPCQGREHNHYWGRGDPAGVPEVVGFRGAQNVHAGSGRFMHGHAWAKHGQCTGNARACTGTARGNSRGSALEKSPYNKALPPAAATRASEAPVVVRGAHMPGTPCLHGCRLARVSADPRQALGLGQKFWEHLR